MSFLNEDLTFDFWCNFFTTVFLRTTCLQREVDAASMLLDRSAASTLNVSRVPLNRFAVDSILAHDYKSSQVQWVISIYATQDIRLSSESK